MERVDLCRVFASVVLFCYVALRTLIIYIDKMVYIDPKLSENFYSAWVRCFDGTLLCPETIKRVPSNSSMSSASGSSMTVLPEATNRDFDTVSIESCGLSSLALQSIREQMAISLERTKLLEDQVKLIPQLKVCFPVYFQMFFANCVINSVLPVSVVVKYIKLSLRSKITFSFFSHHFLYRISIYSASSLSLSLIKNRNQFLISY
jgi:hypothetical protein